MLLTAHRRRGGRAFAWLLVGLLAGGAAGAGTMWLIKQGKDGIPGGPRLGEATELDMVPGDAAGFVHVRVRDVWKADQLSGLRNIIEKAGPDALAALDEGFVPAPSTIDRLTLVFLDKPALGGPGRPLPGGLDLPFDVPTPDVGGTVILLTFTTPFDAAKFRSSAMPEADRKTIAGRDVWADKGSDLAAFFPSDTVLVVGSVKPVEQFVSKLPKDGKHPAGPLTPALEVAARGGRHAVLGLNLKQFGPLVGPDFFEGAPTDVKPLEPHLRALLKAEALAVGLALGKDEFRFDVRAAYANEADAGAAEAAVRPVTEFLHKKLEEPKAQLRELMAGKGEQGKPRPVKELPTAALYLAGLGALNNLDEYLVKPPVRSDGKELVATFEVSGLGAVVTGGAAVGAALLLPAVDKVRGAADRMKSSNNLKQMAIAIHSYHDAYGACPTPAWTESPVAGRKPGGLSWRVHILPFVEQDNLYRQFKLDEPWDSEHNKKLIPLMPQVYASPTAPAEPGKTYYKVFTGPATMFPPGPRGVTLAQVADGTSNTIMVIEGGEAVTWTKPDDIPFTGTVVPSSLHLNGNRRVQAAMGDGSVRTIDLDAVDGATLAAAVTRNGGEVVDLDARPGGMRPLPKGPVPGGGVGPPPVKLPKK